MSARLARLVPGLFLALALLPATSTAATINFKVVNSKGIPQAQISVQSPSRVLLGNGNGEVSVPNLQPGEVVYFTRQLQPSSDPCEATPEGDPGVAYVVPSPAPASATVTLPALAFQPYEPGLSARERGLVGLINDERRARGLAPLTISTVLDEATDGYLAYVPSPPASNSAAHCSLYGARLRMLDAGYPLATTSAETVAWASSATEAFESWMSSTPHREILLGAKWNAIGVANKGETWVANFAVTDPAFASRAGLTSDYGDAGLADKSSSQPRAGRSEDRAQRNPGLSFKRLKVRGQRLQLRVKIAAGAVAEGQLRVIARQGQKKRALRFSGLEARSRLGEGRWTIEVRFAHGARAEFLNTTITRRVHVKGVRAASAH